MMAFERRGIDIAVWRERMNRPLDLEEVESVLQTRNEGTVSVIADCTASTEISDSYARWLGRGLHVVTANKLANSGPIETYHAIRTAAKSSGVRFLYEANVGAGLPIIRTLRDLLRTGDEINRIEGVLSGTLSYIFNQVDSRTPLSKVVVEAKRLGYTEPDPREDLSGTDVARKVVILARELGIEVSLPEVPVKSLVPEPLQDTSSVDVKTFVSRLEEFDTSIAAVVEKAEKQDAVLRYVGVIDGRTGTCAVELRKYSKSHPFGSLHLSDNIISIQTREYASMPLLIKGPGAGNGVTAAGVLADILSIVL
mmetsp:Transcript_7055/g.21526  ORF Transcript_7055/g.21526 Transcript_7055/m.21526 type:complete len:310 (+) Transcript_7055:436-1365(+)